ncbi:MAG: alpha-amylase [Chlorobiales bacterium]|nr:alpha-amylase [Chlorobiales bacterium]
MSLEKILVSLKSLDTSSDYSVPTLWDSGEVSIKYVNPATYYTTAIENILSQPKAQLQPGTGGEWTKSSAIYNVFVRVTTAFDHNQDGKIEIEPSASGFRETGTFLKSIALLPYIKQLGASVVHLLPITSIGQDGNKGTLGSPYAIKNPYKIDENLSEPALKLGVEAEFKAFVDACHHLGLRVVTEFVFRTMSKDGDWIPEHPDWFYWINDRTPNRAPGTSDEQSYGNPIFSEEELKVIKAKVEEKSLNSLPEPHRVYKDMFVSTPTRVEMQNGRYVGTTADGKTCRIPGAFADWPPDDIQPPWNDVTYLKIFDHPDFNYIAYNTIRMYDERLENNAYANCTLWEKIIGIIPHYKKEYGIDGVMIDMGHALPSTLKQELISTARECDPDFAFWDENFKTTETGRKEGYNAVMGSIPFVGDKPNEFKGYINYLGQVGAPLPVFGTAENHNCPRNAARLGGGKTGMMYSKLVWSLCAVLPAVPFIHSGMEICETQPINTGLDFTPEEQKRYPSETLPLFSEYAYNWATANRFPTLNNYIRHILEVRAKYLDVIMCGIPGALFAIETENPKLLVIQREANGKKLLFAGNYNFENRESCSLWLDTNQSAAVDLFSEKSYRVENGSVWLTLEPGESVLFAL